ncbi:LAME_0H08526g1_1 [Lachancea meyersii CBS 8951]|uniref:LAME_0H08526g1_1 n=1 Tax=Lachancea meyersii CBS 8951 TaxID=1266667 RepID=A0A1G4KFK5_9SACH|nr:LAME_0H08526g1_1 [Lachancea meyersii CBS 8951]
MGRQKYTFREVPKCTSSILCVATNRTFELGYKYDGLPACSHHICSQRLPWRSSVRQSMMGESERAMEQQQESKFDHQRHFTQLDRPDKKLHEYKFPEHSSKNESAPPSEPPLGTSPKSQTSLGVGPDCCQLWTSGYQHSDKYTVWWKDQHGLSRKSINASSSQQLKKTPSQQCLASDIVPQSPSGRSGLQNRADSLFSIMTISTKSEEYSPTPRKPFHRRSSAISLDKDYLLKSGAFKNTGEGYERRLSRTMHLQESQSRKNGVWLKEDGSAKFSGIMASTSEQLRRNSEPHFKAEVDKFRHGHTRLNSAHAGFPETGNVFHQTIDVDLLKPITSAQNFTLPPKAHRERQDSRGLLPPIVFSDSCSHDSEGDVSKADDNELLTLSEFLESSLQM